MSMWIYFQALEPAGLPERTADFETLFDADHDELRRRVRAGDAVWLESGFFQLNEVYWPPRTPGGDRELPVFGGRHLPDAGGGPGHVALDPADVVRAAAYLESVSFPDLWREWCRLPSWGPDEELERRLAVYHERLRSFYGAAAERGRAVAKYFSV